MYCAFCPFSDRTTEQCHMFLTNPRQWFCPQLHFISFVYSEVDNWISFTRTPGRQFEFRGRLPQQRLQLGKEDGWRCNWLQLVVSRMFADWNHQNDFDKGTHQAASRGSKEATTNTAIISKTTLEVWRLSKSVATRRDCTLHFLVN